MLIDTNTFTKDFTYSQFINLVEKNELHKRTRLDCINWFVIAFGCVDKTIFGYVQRAYADGFFKG